jgi:hypothetical protein
MSFKFISASDLEKKKPPPGPRTEEIMPDFLSLKKICSRNSGDMDSTSEIVLIDTGFCPFDSLAKAKVARNA